MDLITELLTKDDAASSQQQQAAKTESSKEAETSAPVSSRPATRLATRTITYTSLASGVDEAEGSPSEDDEKSDHHESEKSSSKKKEPAVNDDEEQKRKGKIVAKAPEVVSADASGPVVYCLCRAEDDGSMMILCETCEDWFHPRCVGLTIRAAKQLGDDDIPYLCPTCTGLFLLYWPQQPSFCFVDVSSCFLCFCHRRHCPAA